MSKCACNGACNCACIDCACAARIDATGNRPGLQRISYRAGTYASFYTAMLADLSKSPPLRALHTRAADDAAIAVLDAWAVAADVLSFYSERIANEQYLRTATERRSVLELARLTGYRLRPGVAASVYLAYQVDANAAPLTIAAGTRSQSVPAPGEQMQTFETAEPLDARAAWNAIKPRLTQPQLRDAASVLTQGLYLQGLTTGLKVNDALLVRFGEGSSLAGLAYFRVDGVALEEAAGRTRIRLRPWSGAAVDAHGAAALAGQPHGDGPRLDGRSAVSERAHDAAAPVRPSDLISDVIASLSVAPQIQPGNALRLPRDPALAFTGGADVYPQLLQQLKPALEGTLYGALRTAAVAPPLPLQVYALRLAAPLFAHNAPRQPTPNAGPDSPRVTGPGDYADPTIASTWGDFATLVSGEGLPHIALDRPYETLQPGQDSYVLIDRPALGTTVVGTTGVEIPAATTLHRISAVNRATMGTPAGAAFDVTQLALRGPWLADLKGGSRGDPTGDAARAAVLASTAALRGSRVYAHSELLELAEEPLADALCDHDGRPVEIELDGLYDGLKPGRWLFLSGERSDIAGVARVAATELVMLAAVRTAARLVASSSSEEQARAADGERLHTFITLARPLAYCYKRSSVSLQANVVRATHGETRREALGGGDPASAFQQFALKQGPVTYVAAASETGVESTLALRVNGLLWHEQVTLAATGPHSRAYVTRRDDAGQTRVIFGDGQHGQKPAAGADNISALYRSGIGSGGNVGAGQITLALDKPLGVASVVNPLRASGGADADRLQQARSNVPLALMTLGRLVSVSDYADFARAFAGIGKASALLERSGGQSRVTVTIAGIDDAPIDESADLFRQLLAAMTQLSDPQLRLRLRVREALSLALRVQVALLPDYGWEELAPRLRAALYLGFGFERREIGQAVVDSAIVGAIARVRGVAWARVETRVYSESELIAGLSPKPPSGIRRVTPAQIAYLTTRVADALILELLP